MANTTVVLAPGAWHKAACFDRIRSELQARGTATAAVEYPSVGAEPPTKTLADDVAAIRAVVAPLAEAGREVVLLVHSYGGIPGANAVQGLSWADRAKAGLTGGVTMLIYLSAFVTPKGKTLLDMVGGHFTPWIEGNYARVLDPKTVFYHDSTDEQYEEALKALSHESRPVFDGVVEYEPWYDIPAAYFVCEADRALPPVFQEEMVSLLGPDIFVARLSSSHTPFFSAVPQLADAIEKATQIGHEKTQT